MTSLSTKTAGARRAPRKPPMIVVGAGLVGALWALLLRRRGYEVDVHERRRDPRRHLLDGGRSINLVITSRGLRALEVAGLSDKAEALAVKVYGRMIHSKTGELAYQAYGQENECNLSISRAELNKFLIDEAEKAGAIFHFDDPFLELNPARRIAFFSNSGESPYKVLFAADGAGSKVRHCLAAKFPERFKDEIQWLEADYKELTLPLAVDGQPPLRTDALHIWPRGAHMMMALANKDGSFTVTLYLPKQGDISFDSIKTREQINDLFRKEFPDAIPLMPLHGDEYLANPQGHLGTLRGGDWVHDDSVVLMGDAAHAIVPFFGQGMNCGFEDCTELLRLLDEKMTSTATDSASAPGSDPDLRDSLDWRGLLEAYQRTRRPDAQAIADMALENWVEMKDKVADPRFLFRKKVESALEQRFPEIYKSRYGMITYTLVPYALAQKAGVVQDSLLGQLIEDKNSLDEIDWDQAQSLLERHWVPLVRDHKMDLSRYTSEK